MIRFRWVVVAVWIVGTPVAARALPSLASVTQSNNTQFLPASAPSQHASSLASPFQTANLGATALLIASRSTATLTSSDDAAIDQVDLGREIEIGDHTASNRRSYRMFHVRGPQDVVPGSGTATTTLAEFIGVKKSTGPSVVGGMFLNSQLPVPLEITAPIGTEGRVATVMYSTCT